MSSLVASSLFLWAFFLIRPKILISDKISISPNAEGKKEYLIKVVNQGNRSAININAELYIVNNSNVNSGTIDEHTKIPLKFSHLMELNKFSIDNKSEDFAWYFAIQDDIEKLWLNHNNRRLKFKVIATDSISGFSKVFIKSFNNISCIIDGDFIYGSSLEIIDKP